MTILAPSWRQLIQQSNIFVQAINVLDTQPSSSSPFIIADFGSAHGRNSMHIMKTIIQCLKETQQSSTMKDKF